MQRSPVGTTVLATLIAAFILFPVYWMVVTSLLPTDIVLSRDPPLLPPLSAISLQAYADVFERKPLLTWLVNTLFVTLGSVAVALVISTLAGYTMPGDVSASKRYWHEDIISPEVEVSTNGTIIAEMVQTDIATMAWHRPKPIGDQFLNYPPAFQPFSQIIYI